MTTFKHGKIITALLLASILFFTSCKKDKSEEIPSGSQQKLEKISFGDEFLSFVYNTDGTLKQAVVKDDLASGGAPVTYNILYDAQKRMSEVNTSEGEKLVPVYVNNKLEKVEVKDNTNTVIGRTDYVYNGNQVTSATVRTSLFGPLADLMKFEFTYSATGNLTRTNLFIANPVTQLLAPAGHVEYEHDNKENPLTPVSEFLKLVWFIPSKNNISKEVHKDENLVLEETMEYTYTYNSRNLPQAGIAKRTVPGSPVENLTLQVMYK